MSMGLKLAGTAVLALTGMATGKLVEKVWEGVTKKPVPREDDETVSLVQLVIFAALSAAIVAVVQHFSMKKMSQWYGSKDADSQVDNVQEAQLVTSSPTEK